MTVPTQKDGSTDVNHPHLAPELDGKADGLHGVRMASYEKATEENAFEVVPLGMHVRQLANVICNHPAININTAQEETIRVLTTQGSAGA